ncbi:hypothetical protein BD309DRAFT_872665 [Dichomitus squalens]|nr:hypothetical protein BD309DRAFT_872665 [Dichomitus squalens]
MSLVFARHGLGICVHLPSGITNGESVVLCQFGLRGITTGDDAREELGKYGYADPPLHCLELSCRRHNHIFVPLTVTPRDSFTCTLVGNQSDMSGLGTSGSGGLCLPYRYLSVSISILPVQRGWRP